MGEQFDSCEENLERGKKELGIDEAIVEDGRAEGCDVTTDYVERNFDRGLRALWKRLTMSPQRPAPTSTPLKPKEDPDARR